MAYIFDIRDTCDQLTLSFCHFSRIGRSTQPLISTVFIRISDSSFFFSFNLT